jgi:four helix bundle protein
VGKIERFEDLIAWQKARELTRSIYEVTRQGAFAKDYGLSGQIQRAAISMMSNIAEGFERGRLREFHQFLSTVKASCAEVRAQLYASFDIGYLEKGDFDRLMAQSEEVARVIGGLRSSVQKKREIQEGKTYN